MLLFSFDFKQTSTKGFVMADDEWDAESKVEQSLRCESKDYVLEEITDLEEVKKILANSINGVTIFM